MAIMQVLPLVLSLTLIGSTYCQSTLIANPEHSGIPTNVPNPYLNPHGNESTWINQHNQSWFNSSVPNSVFSNATDSNGNFEAAYYPGRAPAIPLAVRSPYTSAWASTANNGSLNSQFPIFWEGSALGWEGIVTVDGQSYEWMGVGSRTLPQLSNFSPASPISTSYDSSHSNFTFAAGPVELIASFFSPVIPQDLCRTSIPLSYLSVSVVSRDGNAHNVSLYTDINGAWVTQPAAPLEWQMYQNANPVNSSNVTTDDASSLYTWIIQLQNQYEFGENYGQAVAQASQGVFPQWGNFTWSSSQGPATSIRFQSGYSVNQRFQYVTGQSLNDVVDKAYRSYTESEPVFAFQHDLGEISAASTQTVPVVYTIGHVVTPAIRFLSSVGIESLYPLWNTTSCYGDLNSMIRFHYNDLAEAQSLAGQFEAKLKRDINTYYGNPDNNTVTIGQSSLSANFSATNGYVNGTDQFGNQYIFDSDTAYGWLEYPGDGCVLDGLAVPDVSEEQSYYSITALAARQILAAYVLTGPSRATPTNTEPLAFQKEISSNGNMNTVDVIFPAIPFFLWINPDILRYVLAPLYINQEGNFYPNSYSMHDLGSHFPNATGHVEGDDEYMPVEESGNMIIMAYAIYKLTNSLSYLQDHYTILKQWAQYLIEYSLIPAVQLSTDDFSGELANQTNLAIKGIVGLAAMSEISAAVGDSVLALNYSLTATEFYGNWTELAIDPSGKHTILAYQWRSSWGLLYNTYPARLLNLSIIPDSLFQMQSDFYPSVSQLWGVPLDNRHYWTKSDWEMWTAATCQPSTRRLFVNSIAYWLNTTSSDRPFSDLFQTVHEGETIESPDPIEFLARPVQGGLYSLLALVAAGTYA